MALFLKSIILIYIENIKEIRHDFEFVILFNNMDNIYTETLIKVAEGAKFSVNFEHRSLRVDGQYVIKDGKYEGDLGIQPTSVQTVLNHIDKLYQRYRHSIPSERSEAKRKTYFRALSEHELSDDDMLFGQRREEAQIALELYILCMILNNSLKWEEFASDKWFYKSPNTEGFIILKTWITTK